jgi:thioesterase domain-containing protein
MAKCPFEIISGGGGGAGGFVNCMTESSPPVFFLSGSGGGAPNLEALRESVDDKTCFEVIGYPGWKRYVANDFSAEVLISELAAQIVAKLPHGPIRIVGLSMGGHFGYAIGLYLQERGREIAGFCAIDSYMIESAEPAAGWKSRALEQGFELLRKRRLSEFGHFLRSKFWRAIVRLATTRLPSLLTGLTSFSRMPSVSKFDPVFEGELSMRLLVQEVAPWIGSLDQEPAVLKAPAILLRTRLTAGDDAKWRRRCSNIEIIEISGKHHTLFEEENIGSLRQAFIAATRDWRTVR